MTALRTVAEGEDEAADWGEPQSQLSRGLDLMSALRLTQEGDVVVLHDAVLWSFVSARVSS